MNKQNKIIKICIPSTGESLESEIDPRFGRCRYFIMAEVEGDKIISTKSIKNVGAEQGSGAGIAAAELVSESGANVVLTSELGPKSKSILDQLGVEIIKDSGIIKEALGRYIKNIN